MKINTKEVAEKFDRLFRQLRRRLFGLRPVLRTIGEELLSGWRLNWKLETDPYGEKWADLAPSTKRQKRKRGGYQILRDSGDMQNSFHVQATRNTIIIAAGVTYAQYHQFGTKKMPRRMLLPDPDKGLPKGDLEYIREKLLEELGRL